jgi:hypothetical protein
LLQRPVYAERAAALNVTTSCRRIAFVAALVALPALGTAAPPGTTFTYQGSLRDGGRPANGVYDLRFILFDAEAGGSQVGPLLVREDVVATGGLFTVNLDFGAAAFAGSARWIEIAVRPGSSTSAFSTLATRQSLAPAARGVAVQAVPWTGLSGMPVGIADGKDDDAAAALSCAPGQVAKHGASGWVCAADVDTTYEATNGLLRSGTDLLLSWFGCSSGFVLKWMDGGWRCLGDADANSGGDITEVLTPTGSGLSGGATSGPASPSLTFAGTSAATTAAHSDHDHAGVYQAVISGSCASGGVQAVNADGSVGCASTIDPRPRFTLTVVDPTSDARTPAITIGSDGLPLITYYVVMGTGLKVAHCRDIACQAADVRTLVAGQVGSDASVTVGTVGFPLISARDDTLNQLAVIHCGNVACTSRTISHPDTGSNSGYETSAAVGADGLGLITHKETGTNRVRVAHCDDVACTTATVTELGDFQTTPSVAIGGDGLGLISYEQVVSGGTNSDLRVAHCSDPACATFTSTAVDSANVGRDSAITIGADGFGLAGYIEAGGLKVAHCSNATCSAATLTALASAGPASIPSTVMGADGLGLVAYGGSGGIKVAHCSNPACTAAITSTVDGTPQGDAAAALGADGLVVIAYLDSNRHVKVAHCPNVLCNPALRRR